MTGTTENSRMPRWLKRIGWLVIIWGASILALALVAYFLRMVMNAVGLTA